MQSAQEPLAAFGAEWEEEEPSSFWTVLSSDAGRWVLGLVLVEFICQLALLFEPLAPLRLVFRVAAFGFGIVALAVVVSKNGWLGFHPAKQWAMLIILVLLINILIHPTSSSLIAGLATTSFYLAILSPIFWTTQLTIDRRLIETLVGCIFLFQCSSAIFGVLQTYFPGSFQPALSQVIEQSIYGGENLKITLANGASAYRPMGLTDMPGGAGVSGYYAFVFGIGIWLNSQRSLHKLAGVTGILLGTYCIYLSQVRS